MVCLVSATRHNILSSAGGRRGFSCKPLADDFMDEKSPISAINIVRGPNAADSVENLYTTSFLLGDSPYDLVYSDVVWIPKFAAAGWLQDLSDRVSEDELEEFLEADVSAGRYQGGLYRMPFRSAMGMLYYPHRPAGRDRGRAAQHLRRTHCRF